MRVALLGGSFDPPHLAHLQVLRYLLDGGKYDEVWILPAARNPLKPPATPFEHRLAMARLAFSSLGPRVQVREDEAGMSGYTIDLARKLRREHPETAFTFVGGSDLAKEIPRWKEPEALRGLLDFEFLPRPPDPASPFSAFASREIRERAKKSLPLDSFVPKAVADYIIAHKLYLSS